MIAITNFSQQLELIKAHSDPDAIIERLLGLESSGSDSPKSTPSPQGRPEIQFDLDDVRNKGYRQLKEEGILPSDLSWGSWIQMVSQRFPNAKLELYEIEEARKLALARKTYKEIGEILGPSDKTIADMVTGSRTYKGLAPLNDPPKEHVEAELDSTQMEARLGSEYGN